MLTVHVHIHVKADALAAFTAATLENVKASRREPGVARFDLLRQNDDETRFVLVEVYRTPDAPAQHKETDHYKRWRETVAEMMAEARTSIKYTDLLPAED